MKRLLSLLILLQLVVSTEIRSQSPEKDFVIIGVVSGNLNLIQIQMRYEGAQNAYFIKESSSSGVEQIADAIEGQHINDLHIYTSGNGKDLFLTGQPVTIENVNDYTVSLKRWKKWVSGKVIVHIESNTTSPEINSLLLKMSDLAELEFKMLR
jgi:hypothetical protein